MPRHDGQHISRLPSVHALTICGEWLFLGADDGGDLTVSLILKYPEFLDLH